MVGMLVLSLTKTYNESIVYCDRVRLHMYIIICGLFIFLPTGSQISLDACVEIQPVKHSMIVLFKFIVGLGSAFEFYWLGKRNTIMF